MCWRICRRISLVRAGDIGSGGGALLGISFEGSIGDPSVVIQWCAADLLSGWGMGNGKAG